MNGQNDTIAHLCDADMRTTTTSLPGHVPAAAIFTIEDVCTQYIHDMTHQMLDAAMQLARMGSLQIGRPE